jgi:Ca2+/Na+ antiporter
MSKKGRLLHVIEWICSPTLSFLRLVLPLETLPELAFVALLCLFFLSTDFLLTVVAVLSVYTRLSHLLIALTVIAWGASPIELINLTVAARKKELQLGITSVLGGIVIGFYLIIPSAMLFKMARRQTHEIQVLQTNSHTLIWPALAVALATLLVYGKTGMQLGRWSASLLLSFYASYVACMAYLLQ